MFGLFKKKDPDAELKNAFRAVGAENLEILGPFTELIEAINKDSNYEGMAKVEFKILAVKKLIEDTEAKTPGMLNNIFSAANAAIGVIEPAYSKHPTKKGSGASASQVYLMACYAIIDASSGEK